jgi:1-acyl-sn-glycerol-3-phosphate acyltransferase
MSDGRDDAPSARGQRPWRALRLASLGARLTQAAADYALASRLGTRPPALVERSRWLIRNAQRIGHALGLRCIRHGSPPNQGLLVSNHLSYVDIVAFGCLQPMVFVSKSEVRHWPAFGWFAQCAGTLMLERGNRNDLVRVARAFESVVAQGVVVTLFPEGTSSAGHEVLPFFPSLFESAVQHNWPVTPAWIGYELADGCVENEVCWWGDMTLGPHLLNLLGKRRITAHVVFGSPLRGHANRKQLARTAHAQVCALRDQFRLRRRSPDPGSTPPQPEQEPQQRQQQEARAET